MIIKNSKQVPRWRILKCLPVPENSGASPTSRAGPGMTWPVPANAKPIKRLQIYRYDSASGESPRIDT